MISNESYKSLQYTYGRTSSWAIWRLPDDGTPKSHTGDLSVFKDENIITKLNSGYVFVGLNASSTHGDNGINKTENWGNFHSDYSRQNDYKLRYALMNTKYWGSYLTDIIKDYPEVDSSKVIKKLESDEQLVKHNIDIFLKEISLLDEKPIIIALGNAAFNILHKYLSKDFKIYKIKHYSAYISKEKYREHVLSVLDF